MNRSSLRSLSLPAVAAFVIAALPAILGCGSNSAVMTSDAGMGGTGGTGGSGGTTASGAGGHGGATATGAAGSGSGGTNATGTAGGSGSTGAGGSTSVGTTQCNDGIDNDGDGLIDTADPECTGPRDNDESSFATGIPGDNKDACKQDCFFDGNSGMGDDGCLWQLQCDPLSTEAKCPYSADFVAQHSTECSISSSQSQHCIDFCESVTPNGCDCFGCCVVPGASTPIRLDSTCKTVADFGDPAKCPACTQVTSCSKTCGHCELCLGKTTLPADCTPDGGTPIPECDPGIQPCGTGLPACPETALCITGCCLPRS